VGEPWELNEFAGDRIADTGLALSFERRTRHLAAHVAASARRRKAVERGTEALFGVARACE
jgi:hypothetical protein